MHERVRQLRTDKGLTQTEFAQRLGVKRNTIAMYEAGNRTPTNALITSMSRAFHVREEWLRTGEGEMYEETAETLLDQLAAEYSLGPAGRMIVQAALKVYRVAGEQAFVDLVKELLPMMQDIAQGAEASKLNRALSAQETDSAQSGTE